MKTNHNTKNTDAPLSKHAAARRRLAYRLMNDYPFDTPPKRLYKYTTVRRALNALRKNKIYFAKPSQFNDPFDGFYLINTEAPEIKKLHVENIEQFMKNNKIPITYDWINARKKFMTDSKYAEYHAKQSAKSFKQTERTGFCCLSEVKNSLPMWAHYADNHAGCCLMFDFANYCVSDCESKRFPFMHIKKIKYCNKLQNFNLNPEELPYTYKSAEWKYEKEWRAVMYDYNENYKGGGLYKFPKNILHGIILGYSMRDSDKERVIKAARRRKIKIYETDMNPKNYRMKIKLIKGLK